jgi:hypothetical protein
MAVLVVGTEKNFTALRPRLFTARVSPAAAREAKEAVAEANPDVDLDDLQPGTVLTIPDAPRLSVRGELSLDETPKRALEGVAVAGAQALEELSAAAQAAERERGAERERLTAALDSGELQAAMRKEAGLKADVEATRAALEEEEARANDRTAALKQAQADWTKEMEALRELF